MGRWGKGQRGASWADNCKATYAIFKLGAVLVRLRKGIEDKKRALGAASYD